MGTIIALINLLITFIGIHISRLAYKKSVSIFGEHDTHMVALFCIVPVLNVMWVVITSASLVAYYTSKLKWIFDVVFLPEETK